MKKTQQQRHLLIDFHEKFIDPIHVTMPLNAMFREIWWINFCITLATQLTQAEAQKHRHFQKSFSNRVGDITKRVNPSKSQV